MARKNLSKMGGAEGSLMLAEDIKDNEEFSKMTFTGNGGRNWSDGGPVTAGTGMTEADFSNKKLGPAGATILAAWIEHK